MMFEKEIRFIVDFNINKIKRLGAFFTVNDLINSDIHPAIIQYISAELNYLLHLDRRKILKESVFDYSGKEIAQLFEKIGEIIRNNKLLPFEDTKRLVEQAVIFNVNFVIRPRWTLKRFVYDSEEIRNFNDIKLFLKYCYFYDYYPNILVAFFDKKNLLEIPVSEFDKALSKIEMELLRTQSRIIIDDSLKALSEFINIGESNKKIIGVGMVETFLKEKGLQDYITKIRTLLSDDPKQKFEVDEFKNAIYSGIPIGTESSALFAVSRPESVPDQSTESLPKINKGLFSSFTNTSSKEGDSRITDSHKEEEQLNQLELFLNSKLNIFKETGNDSSEQNGNSDSDRRGTGTLELFDDASLRENKKIKEEPLFAGQNSVPNIEQLSNPVEHNQEQSEPDSSSASQSPGILEYFSNRETMRIISSIFNNDSMDFITTMEKINESQDRESALSLINSVFLSYKINAFSSQEASMIIQRVEKYFSEK